jgi:hypothetical protein
MPLAADKLTQYVMSLGKVAFRIIGAEYGGYLTVNWMLRGQILLSPLLGKQFSHILYFAASLLSLDKDNLSSVLRKECTTSSCSKDIVSGKLVHCIQWFNLLPTTGNFVLTLRNIGTVTIRCTLNFTD